MRTKILKRIGLIVAAPVVILVIALVFLAHSPGERLIKGWLEGRLAAELGVPVSIGRFETDLWSRVQLFELAVLSGSGTNPDTVLYVRYARVGYFIPDLLGETPALKALVVDGAEVKFALDSLGKTGLSLIDSPPPETTETESEALAIIIDTVSLSDLKIDYSDAQIPVFVQMIDVAMQARGSQQPQYSGQLTADSICARYDSLVLRVNDFGVDASFDGEILNIASAQAEVAGLIWEAQGKLAASAEGEIALSSSLQGEPGELLNMFADAYGLTGLKMGEFAIQAEVTGTLTEPMVKLKAVGHDFALNSMQVSSIELQTRYHYDSLLVDSFFAASLGGNITGHGQLSFDSAALSTLNLEIKGIDVAGIWRSIYGEPSPYGGTVSGSILASGKGQEWSAWKAEANLQATNLRYESQKIPDLSCELTYMEETADLSLKHGANVIQASVAIGGREIGGEFNVSVPDVAVLAGFFNQPELSGQLWASGKISGTADNISVESSADGSGILYRNFPVDSFFLDLSYGNNILFIEQASCRGNLEMVDSSPAPFNIDSLRGSLHYVCEVSGPLDSLSGQITAEFRSPQYRTYSADSITLYATLAGPRIDLVSLNLFRDSLRVEANGFYDTLVSAGSFYGQLQSPGDTADGTKPPPATDSMLMKPRGTLTANFSIQHDTLLNANVQVEKIWLGLIRYFTEDTTIHDGYLDFDITADGSFSAPEARLNASMRAVRLTDLLVDSIIASVKLNEDEIRLENFTAAALGHSLLATGVLELRRSADGSLSVTTDASTSGNITTRDFDLSVLRPFLFPEGHISGNASAFLTWSGVLSSPNLNGWLRVDSAQVQMTDGSVPLENLFLDVSLADSILSIDTGRALVSDIPVYLTGTLTATGMTTVTADLRLTSRALGLLSIGGTVSEEAVQLGITSDNMDLTVLAPFLSGVDSLSGNLTARLDIGGSPVLPELNGSVGIYDFSLYASRHFIELTGGNAGIRFDRDRVILDSLRAILNGGGVSLSGRVSHDRGNIVDMDLDLHAENIKFHDPELYLFTVQDATLAFARREDNYVLDGDVRLGETRLTAKFRPQSILPWVQSVETVEWELPEMLARSRLDIRVGESKSVWVDNNLARMRIHAALNIIGTPTRPNFSGMIDVEEGYLLYLDRRFKVNQGTVYFTDPILFNPEVTLDASTQVTTYRRTAATSYIIHINAEGPLNQLKYGLYSEPALDKPDIVALLTIGATRDELAGKGEGKEEGGMKKVLADRAALLTSQRISGYVSRKAGSVFGFDEFTIEGNLFQFNGSEGPQLVASRRVSKRVDLTYSTTVGHLNDQTIQLGYHLTPRISLLGETDRYGRAGIDLKYGFTFK